MLIGYLEVLIGCLAKDVNRPGVWTAVCTAIDRSIIFSAGATYAATHIYTYTYMKVYAL